MRTALCLLLLFLFSPTIPAAETPTDRPPASETPIEEAPLENVIRWATASEVDNFGYDIFRGPTEEGPFQRINPTPVAGHGTTDVPQKYEYRDTTIEPDTVYWYYVESISLQGIREKFTPVFPSRPKSRNGVGR